MKAVSKALLALALLGGLSQFAEAGTKKKLQVTGEAGFVSGTMTVGVGVKRGKYTVDAHKSVGSEEKSAVSVGIFRDILKLDKLTLGAGLSAVKSEKMGKRNTKTVTTEQTYDLNLNYDLSNKYKLRGTVNSNGDVKFGFGVSF